MRITSALIQLGADRSYQRQDERTRLSTPVTSGDKVTLSFLARQSSSQQFSSQLSNSTIRQQDGSTTNHASLQESSSAEQQSESTFIGQTVTAAPNSSEIIHHSFSEEEALSFVGNGSITMADGRQVEFSLEMLMQRQFELEEFGSADQLSIMADPLVVNFSGKPISLSETDYGFDLNDDGIKELISFTSPGSGFLALDGNGDGIINNGSELFGPSQGNGYQELAAFDSDENGWIDENDEVFSRLAVWSRDSGGKEQLRSLAELGIGALSLQGIDTPFAITDHSNRVQGQIRQSAIMVMESGEVSTMQQLDLRVTVPLQADPGEETGQTLKGPGLPEHFQGLFDSQSEIYTKVSDYFHKQLEEEDALDIELPMGMDELVIKQLVKSLQEAKQKSH